MRYFLLWQWNGDTVVEIEASEHSDTSLTVSEADLLTRPDGVELLAEWRSGDDSRTTDDRRPRGKKQAAGRDPG